MFDALSCQGLPRMAGTRGTRQGERGAGDTRMMCRLLHHCTGCGSSLEKRHQRHSLVGAGDPVWAYSEHHNQSSEHSCATSLQRKPWCSWHNVQLNAFRNRHNNSVIAPLRTTCHGPCHLQGILMAGLVNIAKPWMIDTVLCNPLPSSGPIGYC